MPLTVVLDTSIIVRALISETSWSAQILDAIIAGEIRLAISPAILRELRSTLQKPSVRPYTKFTDRDIEELIRLLRDLSILTTDLYHTEIVRNDATDDKFLGCAIESDASYIVSADSQHLLSLKTFRLLDYKVDIIEPEHLIQLLEQ